FTLRENVFYDAVDVEYDLGYIEIPLSIKLRSDQFFRITYWGQFGLAPQINISATATSSDGAFNGGSVSDMIRLFNLNMLVGGGIEYDVGGHTALNLGFQYSDGLVDLTTLENPEETTSFNAIRIVLGVMF
ncbi:MAG TPA: outer membrane beta-barrel protein, partial [Prolixibacteraceae bacterium]|nr:outer membrane beta-barrel protein [Prolixibacteraceae bacterium]